MATTSVDNQIVAREELKKLNLMLTDLVCKEFALGDREAKTASSSPATYVLGKGIRDIAIENEWDKCAFEAWYNMLRKCYGKGIKDTGGIYRVCKSWLLFSNFRAFYKNKKGYNLFLLDNCYEFNEKSVAIVPKPLQKMLYADQHRELKGISQVVRDKAGNITQYRATTDFFGERYNIGYFPTALEAIAAYFKFKYQRLMEEVQFWLNEELLTWEDYRKIEFTLQKRYVQN
jgi:hypothetical protein